MKDRLTSLKKSENKGTQELVQDPIDSLEEIKKSFRRNVYKDDMDQFFWVKKYDKLQRGDNFVDAEGKGNVFCFVLFCFGLIWVNIHWANVWGRGLPLPWKNDN